MFKKSEWLRDNSDFIKVGLIIILVLWILIPILSSVHSLDDPNPYDSRFDSFNSRYQQGTPEYKDWLVRLKAVNAETEKIIEQAKPRAKNKDYTSFDYFVDLNKVMDLEEQYNFNLLQGGSDPTDQLMRLSWNSVRPDQLNIEQQNYIAKVKDRYETRIGLAGLINENETLQSFLTKVIKWLAKIYLKVMLIIFLIYIIRFAEQDFAVELVKTWHHERKSYYNDKKRMPGTLSFKDEILLCPTRFLLRVVLWPIYCMKYPLYESTAEMLRYNRLKAEFLRYKPVGYQISAQEDMILRQKARLQFKDYDKVIQSVSEFQITYTTVRRSLAAAYLSLLIGILLQPVIVLASKSNDHVKEHFHGKVQIVKIQSEQQIEPSGPDPPDYQQGKHFALMQRTEFLLIYIQSFIVMIQKFFKRQEFREKIEHIPIFLVV